MKKLQLLLFTCLMIWACQPSVHGQQYVGRILIDNHYEYCKIASREDQWSISFPFSPTLERQSLTEDPKNNTPFKLLINGDQWTFKPEFQSNGALKMEISNEFDNQNSTFYLQQSPIPNNMLSKYAGAFKDQYNNMTLVVNQTDHLSIISPYSKEDFSLKPIGDDQFWAASGELWKFKKEENGEFKSLELVPPSGKSILLEKKQAYSIKEVWIKHHKDTLFGKLFLAQSNDKTPACLLLQGGGSAGLSNYEYEARYLAANGITTLLCNKAGEGKSKGPSRFSTQSFEEKNKEYISLFHFLRNQASVNPDKVGVHGLSEGGRLALMMAIDLKDTLAFAIAGAAPIMTMKEGQLYAMDHYHRNLQIDEESNLEVQYIWKEYYDGIIAGQIKQSTISKANKFRNLHQRMFLPPNFTQVPGSPRADDLQNDRIVKECNEIKSPVLLQYGENDQRVHPYKSLENFSKNVNSSLLWKRILYPRANHSFMTPEFKISTAYLQDKLAWIKKFT